MVQNQITFQPSNTVQEFKADNSTFSAVWAQLGAIVNIATRSGPERLSVSFEFFRNDTLDAGTS
jgi:hypothetical protein